jgi:hypothetical protein
MDRRRDRASTFLVDAAKWAEAVEFGSADRQLE